MNQRIKELLDKATYDVLGVKQVDQKLFAKLIVDECCNRMSKETIRHDGYGYNQHALYQILREHFGVEE